MATLIDGIESVFAHSMRLASGQGVKPLATTSSQNAHSLRKLKAELNDGTQLLNELHKQADPVAYLNATVHNGVHHEYKNVSTQRLEAMLYRYYRSASVLPTRSAGRAQFARVLGHQHIKAAKTSAGLEETVLKGLGIGTKHLESNQPLRMPALPNKRLTKEEQSFDDERRMATLAKIIVRALCEREQARIGGQTIEASHNVLQAKEKMLRNATAGARMANLIGYGAFGLYKAVMSLPQRTAGVALGAGIVLLGMPLLAVANLAEFLMYGAKGRQAWEALEQRANNAGVAPYAAAPLTAAAPAPAPVAPSVRKPSKLRKAQPALVVQNASVRSRNGSQSSEQTQSSAAPAYNDAALEENNWA